MVHKFILIILVSALLLFGVVSATSPTTVSASFNGTGQGCVVFTGTSDGSLAKVWFEYGSASNINDGGFWYPAMRTKNQLSITGTYTARECGSPFLPGRTYGVRAAGGSGNLSDPQEPGNILTFSATTITPVPTTTYSVYSDPIFESAEEDNFIKIFMFDTAAGGLTPGDVWQPYVVIAGAALFLGFIAFMIFMNLAVKQMAIANALILGLLIFGIISGYIPPEFQMMTQILIILALTGTAYWLYKTRR